MALIKRVFRWIHTWLRSWHRLPARIKRGKQAIPSRRILTQGDRIVYSIPRAEAVDTLNRTLQGSTAVKPNTLTQPQNRHNRYGDHPDTVAGLADLAYLCDRQGRYSEAEHLYQQVIAYRRQRLGDEHLALADSLSELAAFYQQQKRYDHAQPLLQQALAIRQRLLINDHLQIGEALYQLAGVFYHKKLYGKAEPLYQQTLTIFRKHFGAQHRCTQAVYSDLMSLIATVIESGKFEDLMSELPPLDLNSLGETYVWAKPSWERPKINNLDLE